MIKIVRWSPGDWVSDEKKLRLKDQNSQWFMEKILAKEKPKLRYVGIETINYCNNNCSFCPASVGNDIRPHSTMSESLFRSIIQQLKDMAYTELIGLFNNNEPLLDKRIYEYIEYTKQNLPNATHYLSTNGILLDKKGFARLTESLNHLVIDNYNDDLELMPNIKEIVEDEGLRQTDCDVVVNIRKKTQVLASRAGYSPNKQNNVSFSSPCMLPMYLFYVKPEGKVSVCCQDVYGGTPDGRHEELIIADLNETPVKEAWENKVHMDIVEKISAPKGNRGRLDVCARCDTFGFYQNFEPYLLHGYANALINLAWERKNNGAKIFLSGKKESLIKLNRLLEAHGLLADGIYTGEEDVSDDVFIIFTNYDFDAIFALDNDIAHVGEKYVVFQEAEPLATVYPKEKRILQ